MSRAENFIEIIKPISRPATVFLQGDPGITSLLKDVNFGRREMFRLGKISQRELEDQYGVFVRFQYEGTIYSGIIPVSSESDRIEIATAIQSRVHEKKAKLLTLLQLPNPRMPTFPFFTACDMILSGMYSVKERLAKNYWAKYSNDKDAISEWLRDFLKFRREIVYTVAPQLESEVPYVLSKQTVLVLHDPQSMTVALRYYRSTSNEDVVEVNQTEHGFIGVPSFRPGPSDEDIFSQNFRLPSANELLQEITYFTRVRSKVYHDWGHPYFAAAAELKQHIERYNKLAPRSYEDATYLTEAKLHNWTYVELQTKRELMKRFPELNELFGELAEPVHAVHIYGLREPEPSLFRDGTIETYYFHSDRDEVDTYHMDDDGRAEKVLEKVFGLTAREAFQSETSSISYFLRDKLGKD